MENRNRMPNTQPVILLIGNDSTLGYLLGRFAEQSGCQLMANVEGLSAQEIESINPVSVIFTSIEVLIERQNLIMELSSLDTLIMVCSSAVEEAIAKELGADHCLLHPLNYDDFHTALSNASKHD